MKAGEFRIGARLAICELHQHIGLRRGQFAVPKGLFRCAPRCALNLAQKNRNRLKGRFGYFS